MQKRNRIIALVLFLCAIFPLFLFSCNRTQNPTADSNKTENTDAVQTTAPHSDGSVQAFTATFTASGVQSDYPSIPALFTVNGQPVTYDEYRYVKMWYRMYIASYDSQAHSTQDSEDISDAVEAAVIEQIKALHAVFAEAERLGVALTPAEIAELDAAVASEIEQAGGEDIWREALSGYYESLWFYYYFNAYEKLTEKLQSALSAEKTEQELLQYAQNSDIVRFKQISLLRNESGSNDTAIQNELLAIAGRLQSGEDFDALLKEYATGQTDEQTEERSLNKGFLNFYPDGLLRSESVLSTNVSDVLLALQDNERSGVIRTDTGYAILWRLPKTDEYLRTQLDEIRSLIGETQLEEKISQSIESAEVSYGFAYEKYKHADPATFS